MSRVALNEDTAQQVSYERSSQAQSLTCPPMLLSAAGYVVFAGWRFKFVKQESLNLTGSAADDALLQ